MWYFIRNSSVYEPISTWCVLQSRTQRVLIARKVNGITFEKTMPRSKEKFFLWRGFRDRHIASRHTRHGGDAIMGRRSQSKTTIEVTSSDGGSVAMFRSATM